MNERAPTVSVVIPLYNKGRYIERALSSVLAQRHQPDEIIVVDDGSTDDGPERVKELAKMQPKITLVRQENRGPGAARNAGLARARGKYVSFLDADDEWFPSFLEAGLKMLEDHSLNVSLVSTGFYSYPANKRNGPRSGVAASGVFDIGSVDDVHSVGKILNYQSVCFTIMRTNVVRNYGGFYDNGKCTMGEDRYLLIKLLFNKRIGIIAEQHGIVYREDASGIMSRKWDRFPVPPYITMPEQILNACPEAKRYILKELLFILALETAKCLVANGEGREARKVLNHFRSSGYPQPEGFLAGFLIVTFYRTSLFLYTFRDRCVSIVEKIRMHDKERVSLS